jgi:hypothetical protein
LSVRRACALEWCARRHIDVGLKPLPYGCVRDYFKETGLHGRQHAAWLVRQARALRCTGLNARGVVRAVGSSGRRRMPGAGRPHKAAGLREELFEWFLSVRGTCGTRMPVSALAAAARNLRRSMMAAALRLKRRVPFPQITSAWLLRWRHDYQVSLRLPNRRWKVPLHVLQERVECTWLNLIRVRRLCQLVFGYDPEIEGFDQKPMHFNESGSRMKKTLAWAGQSDVPLKECVAQTRERWTMNTHVRSRVRQVGEWPPLEYYSKVAWASVQRWSVRSGPSALAEITGLSGGLVWQSGRKALIGRSTYSRTCAGTWSRCLQQGNGGFSCAMCTQRIWMLKFALKHSSTGTCSCITGGLYRRPAMQRHALASSTERPIPRT